MGTVVIAASRRALAASVLFAAGMLAVYVVRMSYSHPYRPDAGFGGKAIAPAIANKLAAKEAEITARACAAGHTEYCRSLRPGWAIPVAIAIMLIGVVLAALIHWLRRGRAEHRAVNIARPKPSIL